MIRNVQRTWFEVWGNETAQNRLLKGLLAFLLGLLAIQTIAFSLLALRKPTLIAVTNTESQFLAVTPPNKELVESEVRRAVTGYLTAHYNWNPATIEASFQMAAKFVDPSFVKSFLGANQEHIRLAKEKGLSQRFFVSEMVFDWDKRRVQVEGERIILVEGLRAANSVAIEIKFDLGKRSIENPEGVFIVGENLVSKNLERGGQ
jgi:hypothetical protein